LVAISVVVVVRERRGGLSMNELHSDAFTRTRRAIVSAGALWREGLVPEAHAYMASALRMALRPWVVEGREKASPEPGQEQAATDEERALTALGRAGYRNVERLREALSATAGVAPDVTAESVAIPPPVDFEWIWAEAERLCRFGARRLATPLERKRMRTRTAFVGGIGILLLILVIVRVWVRPHVSASGVYSPDFPASYAVDDIESTEWLLPEHAAGWLQISFSSPRHVHGVVVLNGHNKFYLDRGAERIRVTAFSKTGPIASAEGRFAKLTGDRSPLDLPLDGRDVSEIRLEVLSFFGSGSAIAEVEVR